MKLQTALSIILTAISANVLAENPISAVPASAVTPPATPVNTPATAAPNHPNINLPASPAAIIPAANNIAATAAAEVTKNTTAQTPLPANMKPTESAPIPATCPPKEPEPDLILKERFEVSDGVFVGALEDVRKGFPPDYTGQKGKVSQSLTFKIEKSWKGLAQEKVTVINMNDGPCDGGLTPVYKDLRYLVFTKRSENYLVFTNSKQIIAYTDLDNSRQDLLDMAYRKKPVKINNSPAPSANPAKPQTVSSPAQPTVPVNNQPTTNNTSNVGTAPVSPVEQPQNPAQNPPVNN